MTPPPFSVHSGGLSWERKRLTTILSTIAKIVVGIGLVAGLITLEHPEMLGLQLAVGANLAGLLSMIASYAIWLTRPWEPGEIELTEGELVVRRRRSRVRRISRAQIASAYVVARVIAGVRIATVEIELVTGDRLSARLPGAIEAKELVERLGFGPTGRRTTVHLASPARRLLHPLIGYAAYNGGSFLGSVLSMLLAFNGATGNYQVFPAIAVVAGLLLYQFVLTRMMRAATVTVGDDGLVVARGIRKPTVIPYAEIAEVYPPRGAGRLTFRLRTGKHVALTGPMLDGERQLAVYELASARIAARAHARAPQFERGNRDVGSWRKHVSTLVTDTSYRAASGSADAAAAALASVDAPKDERVGAAIALRVAGDVERVRIAASATADDDFRAVLEAVAADADDAQLEVAMQRIKRIG